uniref:Uncharacterized protein n=1 Tax=Oryza sativa subsp. japonica TaxID=39947 RepID=Q69QB6_ORYSJ|nr:hypothetical protein [Oryza sativa Japonica Group]
MLFIDLIHLTESLRGTHISSCLSLSFPLSFLLNRQLASCQANCARAMADTDYVEGYQFTLSKDLSCFQ